MLLCIYGVDSFLGASFASYAIQRAEFSVLGVFCKGGGVDRLELPMRSRGRFSYQVHLGGVESHNSLLYRFCIDKPDLLLFFGELPTEFHGRDDTVLITADACAVGAHRTLVIPSCVYGPKQYAHEGIGRLFISDSQPSDLSAVKMSFLYVREVFVAFQEFLVSGKRYENVVGHVTTEKDIFAWLSGCEAEVPESAFGSLQHTAAWYAANRWIGRRSENDG